MSTSRKIYIVVLFIFLLVLIWDKTSHRPSATEPQSTSAQVQPAPKRDVTLRDSAFEENLESSLKSAVKPISGSQEFLHPPFATQIDKTKPGETRNLFMATDEFNRLVSKKSQKAEQSQKDLIDLGLKLSGILIGNKNSCVLINGEVVFLGQHIGPYRLVKINPESIVLQADSQCITLLWDEKKILN